MLLDVTIFATTDEPERGVGISEGGVVLDVANTKWLRALFRVGASTLALFGDCAD